MLLPAWWKLLFPVMVVPDRLNSSPTPAHTSETPVEVDSFSQMTAFWIHGEVAPTSYLEWLAITHPTQTTGRKATTTPTSPDARNTPLSLEK